MRRTIAALALVACAAPSHALYKNVAGQRVCLYAWDSSANAPATGIAGSVTIYRSLDGAAPATTGLGAVTELSGANSPGSYCVTVDAGASNADHIAFTATGPANVSLAPVQVYPRTGTNAGQVVATNNDKTDYVLAAQVHAGATIPTVTTSVNLTTNNDKSGYVLAGVTHTGAVIPTVTSVGSVVGHTPQTGDNYVRLGAPATTSIAGDIAQVLSTGGPGPWTTGGSGALTPADVEGMRYRLQLDGTQVAPSADAGGQMPVQPTVWNGQPITTNLATPADVWSEAVDGSETAACLLAAIAAVQKGLYTQNVAGNDVTRTYRNQTDTQDRVVATFNNSTGTRTVATITCP